MDEEVDSFEIRKHTVGITIEKPRKWGEGYAIGLALDILYDRYYQFYGKKWKRMRHE